MDDKQNSGSSAGAAAAKTILVLIIIFGLLFACFVLYLKSLVKRLGGDIEPAPTKATLDTEGWNSVDEDTMNFIKERDATRETYATTSYYNYDDDEAVKALLDEMDKEAARKRAEDIRSVLERDRGNDNNPDKSSDAAETISGTNQENE